MLTSTALTPEAVLVTLPDALKRIFAIAYRGDPSRMESYVRNLSWRGLMEERRIESHSSYSTNRRLGLSLCVPAIGRDIGSRHKAGSRRERRGFRGLVRDWPDNLR
jgi:hypothetical protein